MCLSTVPALCLLYLCYRNADNILSLSLYVNCRVSEDVLSDFEVRIGQSEELDSNALCRRFTSVPPQQDGVVDVVCDRLIYGRCAPSM